MEGIFAIYRQIMESQGRKTGNLLEVLKQGMYHNEPNLYCASILAAHLEVELEDMNSEITGGLDSCVLPVIKRAALVQRHMRDAQTALEEIYEVAKNRGHKDIIDIFEREYHIGHISSSPTQE